MKNKRIFQFAMAGLLIALALQAAGYRMDQAVPRIALSNQTVYNWLTLLFSPVAFFLRLTNPDGPIVAGRGAFFAVVFINAMLYAGFYKVAQLLFFRLQQKKAFQKASSLPAETPVERVTRLASPGLDTRRV